ncbi:MAG TPA: SdrD B-like domain-containing protein [Thermoanaerobaculia bacterium]|nr:SdrD B-like domain-containing protein [Thermoanaerobaculia bacterium]
MLLLGLLAGALPAAAAGVLSVEVASGYNLVVDSNVTSPSTYGPGAAYIGARICNTGDAPLSNVFAYTGNYNSGVGSTPGTFPVHNSTGDLVHPQITNTGNYSLTLESGDLGLSDGTRYIGSLAAGECRMQYWLISYPHCVNVGGNSDTPPCATSITGGIKPDDDLSLNYDVWATTTTGIAAPSVNQRRDFTLRNEISAAANKIWPNTTSKVPDAYLAAIQALIGWGTLGPDGQPLTASNPVYPGQRVITTQGIWYDLGTVGAGFDNDGDLIPDQNAWLQPVGDAGAFDAGCFRMVNVYGIIIVKLKSGGELLMPFQNELYFEHLPENTGVVGLVYYQFIATDQGCSAAMTPYQEAASGFDNEKFSADFGLSNGLSSGTFGPDLTFTKDDGVSATTTGSTLTYTLHAQNDTDVALGAPEFGVPLIVRETIPAGTTYVADSADDSPASNLEEPTGTGSYTEDHTDIDGNVDSCTINYSIASSQWVVMYSNNGGSTWSLTAPVGVTDIQWLLLTTIDLDGSHNGTACVAPNGVSDGTLQTSLPPGKEFRVRFQVTVNASAGPVVCNTGSVGFGSSAATTATDCTIITGNNSLSGNVFKDDGVAGGIYGNGTKDGTEAGIGMGVIVTLYYDLDGDGEVGSADIVYGSTTTNASGAFTFTTLPDGPYLVVVKKYDGPTPDVTNNAATDSGFGTTGWGNTTTNPQLPLTTNQGVLQSAEDTTTVTLAVNIDLAKSNPTGQTPLNAPILGNVNFGFAPPLRLTKGVAGNADLNNDGRADTAVDEGDVVNYTINLENRLPSVGKQGPTGCQYTMWASTGVNGSPASKEFTNPANAWDGPNRTVASALVTGGGNRLMDGSGFTVRTQAGNITKVEALYFGYFGSTLTDDSLSLKLTTGAGNTTTTLGTALIDSYVGEPADLDPNSAVSWDVTSVRPGGGAWTFADAWSTLRLEINPSKSSAADQKTFFLDAIGLRITTDQDCEAGTSTTLRPVPLQDSYDTGSFAFVSASPSPDSVNTGTGVLQWNDVGPILPGSTTTVTVTMQALNLAGSRVGTCGGSSPPTTNSTCNWAETAWGGNNVDYADGRQANDASDNIAVTLQGKGELRGTIWKDTNVDGWPNNDGEPALPNVVVTLWGCVQEDGVTMETNSTNKTCENVTGGNFWKALNTTTTSSSGAYEFIGLDTGFYLIEVGDNNGIPGTGNTSPFGGTQTAEPNDSQAAAAGSATGTNGVCAGGCNNTWGNPAANTNALNLINNPTAEEIIGGINFGYNIPSAVIYGNIWWDINGNAAQNAGEGDLSGFTVQRYSDPNGDGDPADGSLQATTTTDANGNYSFSGLVAGSYVIQVVPPTLLNKAWVETVESTGGTGSLNNQIPITVVAGAISGSHDFGYTQSDTADIGDSIYYDFDGDGIQDATEAGIPNVTIDLYEDVDRDGTIDPGVDEIIQTTSSDASGAYLFQNLPAGSYIVKVDTTDPDFPTEVTATGDPDLTASSIGDLIWLDADGDAVRDAGEDGISGVVVNLYSDDDGSGTLSGGDSLVASTITNVNGNYLFTGLSAGNYFIDVDDATLPSSLLAVTTGNPSATMIALTSNSQSYLLADAGYSLAANFSIGNRLWHDVDNDGVQDPGEPGIPFVDVVVTNGTGTGCAGAGCRVTTDADGFWIVTGLTNGTFTVNVDDTDVDFPRDFTVTTGTTDPRVITVAGVDRTNIDFGYRFTGAGSTPTGSITGRIFQDADGDLAYDLGEARNGTTVNLMDENGNIVATTATAADGTYSFTGIFIGNYAIESVDTLGTRYSTIFLSAAQTFPNLNIIYQTSTETTADDQSSVSVDGVHANLLQDFGYKRFLGSIGDSVYWDVNENASQDIGEPGFAGVTVRLYDAVWSDTNNNGLFESGEGTRTLVATTSTIADNPLTTANEGGTYLFSNVATLASGHQYLVEVDTTTLPGASHTLIADPDTDGFPCTLLPTPDVIGDDFPPPSVCDSQQLIFGFLPGNNYLGADFGYRVNGSGFATIGDQLWIDTDSDGTRDSGEQGIPAISVWLDTDNDGVLDWTDGNGNNVWDTGEGEQWTTSDTDGFYAFTSVANGTYNLKVLTTDPDWPAGLATTPTFEVRSGNTASRNNAVQVVVSGGAVSSIVDGDPATTDTCSSCNLNVDFGYRYAGTNALSGTVCSDDATKNGYCGATATTYSGVTTGESALEGVQVTAYRWTDDGDDTAWSVAGVLDAGDTFQLLGTAPTNASGDYSFANLPDNVVLVFSVSETQNLRLTTTDGNSSVEDANVLKRSFYEGTTTYEGNTVTVVGRQALSIGPDTDNNIQDVDYAFDPTLNGNIAYDYGDLPAGYANTLLANSGAQHRVLPGSIYLGPAVTTENDGIPTADASGDTADNGITMISTTFGMGGGAYINVVTSAAGWLAGWIDFNGDGDFDDADEMILDQAVVSGNNVVFFYVPTTIPNGLTDFFGRFRIYPSRPQIVASTGPGLDSNFQRMNGEVEDYLFPMTVSPTKVEMMSMDAAQGKKHVTLTWKTESEVDNLGFHVYREIGGVREKLNEHIITGSAFMTGRNTVGPRSYRFVDRKPVAGFVQYYIEDVDLDGTRTMNGPVTPHLSNDDSDGAVTTEPDPTLGSAGGRFTTAAGMGVKIPAPAEPAAAQLAEQWQLAGVPAVKVIVTTPGWYRVKKSDLVAAGFDPGTNGKVLSVFSEGTEIPVLVNAKNEGKFDAADSIEFFGRGIDTGSTGGRVYYITARKGSGLRVKTTGGRGNSGSTPPASFPYTFERYERTVFFSSLVTNGERENFYGPVISSWPATQVMTVSNRDSSGTAELEVAVHGATANMQHVIGVQLNGTSIGDVRFDGRVRHVGRLAVPIGLLAAGDNTLTFTGLNGGEDVSVLELLRLVYPHTYRADNDALTFTASAGTAVSVKGFTTTAIRVLDVTDPANPALVDANTGNAPDGSKMVSFASTGSGKRTYFAFTEGRVLAPAQIAWNEPSSWNAATNGANLVILTNRAFVSAANALKTARQAQGITTAVVDVQNVYDEFSYGHHSPHAIRDFLLRTQSWKTKPHYVILVGDSSIDPRNYMGFGSYDFVPTKMVASTFIKTASDDWFADFDGTGLPSLAIGRIPVRTAEQATAVVNKLIARGNAPSGSWTTNVDIVNDAPNGYPFDRAAGQIAATVPAGFNVNRISFTTTPSAPAAIINAFNRGSLLTTYIGHGSVELWSNGYFSSDTAAGLTNSDRQPFVVAMNCLNGYYHDLFTNSLAEALIRNPNGGAIAVWASSALSGVNGQLTATLELNRQLFGAAPITIGDAVLQAKRATGDPDVRKTWILFGDPTMKLK